jgi:NADH dehydrogenase
MNPTRVIIVGGGFAGVACAKRLRRRLATSECEIVVFNPENHMAFHPLLAEVAGASISPDAVGAPLRQMLPDVECRSEKVIDVDLSERMVVYSGHDGLERRMTYDHVVVACGRSVNVGLIPGIADHAFPLKTTADALALRSHVMEQLEKAAVCDEPERRRWYLSFLVVGGGFSGAEVAGEINDLLEESREFFPTLSPDEWKVTVIHSAEQILPEVSPSLRHFARKRMEKAGIAFELDARATAATPEGVWLSDGRLLRGATVVSTIGTSTTHLVERLKAPKHRGRLVTEATMRIQGARDAWAVGDCAAVVNAYDGTVSPTTAQFAQRQGTQVADNITRVLYAWPLRPFTFRPLGQLCSIGGRSAVAEVLGMRMSGFLAWVLWRTTYLFKLPAWSKRVRVGFDWAWQLVFGRDLVHVKASPSERVGHAHFQPGEYVFRRGDQASSLYVIERGEAEVLQERGSSGEQRVAVLRAGDFFGEMALVEQRTRASSVRALTPLSLVVVGRTAFQQLSASLAPIQKLLAAAVKRRNSDPWRVMPNAREMLGHTPLFAFIDRDVARLSPTTRFDQAVEMFTDPAVDVAYVVDDDDVLCGALTRSDLLRGVETLIARGTSQSGIFTVGEMMVSDPLCVTRDDPVPQVAESMREHELERVPVVASATDRRLLGVVRAERMLAYVLARRRAA